MRNSGYVHPDDRPVRPSTSAITVREWRDLCEAYGHRCAYCRREVDTLVIEHNMPECRGGADSLENILPACKSCNNQKCDLTPAEWIFVQHGLLRRNGGRKRGVRVDERTETPERLALLLGYTQPILVFVVKETAEQYRFFPLANHKIGRAPHRYFWADRESFTRKENIQFLGAA